MVDVNPRRTADLARAQAVIELIAQHGATIAETAAVLGTSEETVRRTLMSEERRLAPVDDALREDYRRVQMQRTEELIKHHWQEATRGLSVKSAQLVLRVLERQATMLGLDEPKRQEIDSTITTRLEPDLSAYTTAELERLVDELDRAARAIDVTPLKQLDDGE